MRRSEREITDRQTLLTMLDQAQVMHLGLSGAGQPYVVPLHFGWDEQDRQLFLYFHSASVGKKMSLIRENPACFVSITGGMKVIKAIDACDWSASYESLMIEGVVSIIDSEIDKTRALDAIMCHYGFQGKPAYTEQTLRKTCVCRIAVKSISGKSKPSK